MLQFRLVKVRHAGEIAVVATLFREYADSLGIDLGFQEFETELRNLPGKYAPPAGELMLARSHDGNAVGCVGVRPLDGSAVCEMKRLYVRPAARGVGLGRALIAAIISAAEELGYAQMKLDRAVSVSSRCETALVERLVDRIEAMDRAERYRDPIAVMRGRFARPLRSSHSSGLIVESLLPAPLAVRVIGEFGGAELAVRRCTCGRGRIQRMPRPRKPDRHRYAHGCQQ